MGPTIFLQKITKDALDDFLVGTKSFCLVGTKSFGLVGTKSFGLVGTKSFCLIFFSSTCAKAKFRKKIIFIQTNSFITFTCPIPV